MKKMTTSISITPPCRQNLKFLAFEHGRPVGDIIEAMVKVIQGIDQITEPSTRDLLKTLFETALANSGVKRGGWTGKPPSGDSTDEE